jgi:hypothetical protein
MRCPACFCVGYVSQIDLTDRTALDSAAPAFRLLCCKVGVKLLLLCRSRDAAAEAITGSLIASVF